MLGRLPLQQPACQIWSPLRVKIFSNTKKGKKKIMYEDDTSIINIGINPEKQK
jgi:hypothetical protein